MQPATTIATDPAVRLFHILLQPGITAQAMRTIAFITSTNLVTVVTQSVVWGIGYTPGNWPRAAVPVVPEALRERDGSA